MAHRSSSGKCHPSAHLHGSILDDEGFFGRMLHRERSEGHGGRVIRFGVITGFEEEDPSSRSLLLACGNLGEVRAIEPSSLSVTVGGGVANVRVAGQPATGFDALLLLRGVGPDGNEEVQLGTYRLLEEGGALVMNSPEPLLAAQDKLRTSATLSRAGIPTPDVAVIQKVSDLREAIASLGPSVMKPQWGSLGEGVELLADGEAGLARAASVLEVEGSVYLQSHVDHGGWDLRVFVVGDRVQASIERRAAEGEFRTNVEVGGRVRDVAIDTDVQGWAVASARALGLEWAGVDLVVGKDGPTVIEVNGSPGWEGIQRATGRDMGEAIALHAARRALEWIEPKEARKGRG